MGASGSDILCHDHPKMYLSYSVDDNGNYSVSVSKSNSYDFGYSWKLKVNGTVVITKSASDGDGKSWSSSASGNCGSSFTVTASCGAGSCDLANEKGESKDNYTVVGTINLHSHSAPSGVICSTSGVTDTSFTINFHTDNWGCEHASSWYYRFSTKYPDDSVGWGEKPINSSDNDHDIHDDSVTVDGANPNTTYYVQVLARNKHSYDSSSTVIVVTTEYSKPAISVSNDAPLYIGSTPYYDRSASDTSIRIAGSCTNSNNTGPLTWIFSTNYNEILNGIGSAYNVSGESNKYQWYNLSHGSVYTFYIRAYNNNASTSERKWSDIRSITIRTKYNADNFSRSIVINDIGLEHVVFSTLIKYGNTENTISSAKYKITGGISGDGCSNVSMAVSGNKISKTTSAYVLTPSNSYTITATVTLTTSYDSITFDIKSSSFTTDAKAYFHTSPVNGEFQLPGTYFTSYTVKNPSGNKIKVILRAKSNINSAWTEVSGYTFETQLSDSLLLTKYVDLTDAQWDQIYKLMSNLNSISFDVTIYTYSNRYSGYQMSNTKFYSNESKTLTLTGNKKTMYLGKDGVHRARAYIGVGDTVKKAIVWIGDSSKTPRRTI